MDDLDPRHGTEAGDTAHRRAGQDSCEPCRLARFRASKRRRDQPAKVSSLGARRRIQALQAIGWGRHQIARRLGYTDGGSLNYLMRSETATRRTVQRVAAVYEELCMVRPIGVGPDRARTWAKRHGYAPPLAWDDIDDPNEQPSGTGYQANRGPGDDLADEWDHLRYAGTSIHEAARQLGVTVDAIQTAVRRRERSAA